MREETSLELKINEVFLLESNIEVYLDTYDLLVKKTLFVTKGISSQARIIIDEEHDEFKWVPIEEVNNLLMWDSNFLTFDKVKKFLKINN